MRHSIIFVFFIFVFWICTTHLCASKDHSSWKLSGDILQFTIPATAFGTTLALKDFDGSQEFAKGFIATTATVYGLKYLIHEQRPSHGSHSFPSGHTAIAFFGCGFIHKRYGWKYAIPAYAAATFVGYSRIKIKEHWVHDVIGGAAIGLFYSIFFTTPYQIQSYQFYPALTPDSISLHCERNF
jgi:membrane-associated phospholipid phosphatase